MRGVSGGGRWQRQGAVCCHGREDVLAGGWWRKETQAGLLQRGTALQHIQSPRACLHSHAALNTRAPVHDITCNAAAMRQLPVLRPHPSSHIHAPAIMTRRPACLPVAVMHWSVAGGWICQGYIILVHPLR